MSHSEEYLAMRSRFTEMCIAMAPLLLQGERRRSAPAEFDDFCGNPKVVKVGMASDGFVFATTPLVMTGESGPRWAGEFVIKIFSTTVTIQCRALRRVNIDAYPHPHVQATSLTPCLGSNASAVAKLRGDGKLAELGLLMIDFLEQYSEKTAYHGSVADWARLTQEEEEIWKKGI